MLTRASPCWSLPALTRGSPITWFSVWIFGEVSTGDKLSLSPQTFALKVISEASPLYHNRRIVKLSARNRCTPLRRSARTLSGISPCHRHRARRRAACRGCSLPCTTNSPADRASLRQDRRPEQPNHPPLAASLRWQRTDALPYI